jgi:hypothetical protein
MHHRAQALAGKVDMACGCIIKRTRCLGATCQAKQVLSEVLKQAPISMLSCIGMAFFAVCFAVAFNRSWPGVSGLSLHVLCSSP